MLADASGPVGALIRGTIHHDLEVHPVPRLTYTVPEAAELLGISRTTAYECVRRGEIPSLTLGRRIVITRAQLEHLLGSLPVQRDPAIADQQS